MLRQLRLFVAALEQSGYQIRPMHLVLPYLLIGKMEMQSRE